MELQNLLNLGKSLAYLNLLQDIHLNFTKYFNSFFITSSFILLVAKVLQTKFSMNSLKHFGSYLILKSSHFSLQSSFFSVFHLSSFSSCRCVSYGTLRNLTTIKHLSLKILHLNLCELISYQVAASMEQQPMTLEGFGYVMEWIQSLCFLKELHLNFHR